MSRAGWHHDEETKRRIAEARRAYFARMSTKDREEFGRKISAGVKATVDTMSSEERQRKFGHGEKLAQFYDENPGVRAQISESVERSWSSLSEESRTNRVRNITEGHRASSLPELSRTERWRQRISESVQLLWTDEKRREQSERALRQWLEGRWGDKVLGVHVRNSYPSNWEFIKMVIRERDGNVCRLCGTDGRLHVHHINYNPTDCRWDNLITLCDSHHTQTNFDRDYWQEYLVGILKEEAIGVT